MAKKFVFEFEIEEDIFNLLEEFKEKVQGINTVNDLFLSFIKQGVANGVQQIALSKVSVTVKDDKVQAINS